MGSSSNSSSSSTSQELSDSYNTTTTADSTGNQSVTLLNSGATNNPALTYSYDSGNTTNSASYALGANAQSNASGSPAPSAAGDIDWGEIIVYVIGGIVLVLVLRLFGDKKQ